MKKLIALTLSILMILTLGLASCNTTGQNSDTTAATTDAESTAGTTAATTNESVAGTTETQTEADTTVAETTTAATTGESVEIDGNLSVNVMVLNGTTGFGMAKLMDNNESGTSLLNYNFTVDGDASNITAALLNGTADIAALPTNAAANLFNKKGSVQMLAINTLGVLYLMTGEGVTIESFEDLEGKTVYCPAQNPTFIFKYLCQENGLVDGENITIDNTYTQPADLRTALAAGKVDIAVLPEPMVTIAKSANTDLKVALDLTAEWDKVAPAGSLAQGCVVVRKEFAEAHPAEVKTFLAEYEASINYVKANPTEAGTMIQTHGVFANGAVAGKALPNCNICFISGADMKPILDEFFTILHGVAPASVGNAVPGESFYYVGK
ncbi:MAG: ABC transporter substrate-binding protein [Clostridia bacterium]|nr:ABC transporter substrate-binding protein [Clostridia bacterium]